MGIDMNASSIRVVIEKLDVKGQVIDQKIIKTQKVTHPESLLDFGFRHDDQMKILKNIQQHLIDEQGFLLTDPDFLCPECSSHIINKGFRQSDFHAVFTDHKVAIRKQACSKCRWNSNQSILSIFGTSVHPELTKLQCETAADVSYRASQDTMNRQTVHNRKINNHDRIKNNVELVGNYIAENPDVSIEDIDERLELCVQVDGGHVKTKDPESRSFEAMTSVVFSSENINYTYGYEEKDPNSEIKYKRGKLDSKHCAASALSDGGSSINMLTKIAAEKQGMTGNTVITAICDGADNCWNVVESLKSHCKQIIPILDWFHVSMKFQNISLKTKGIKEKVERAKWFLWHGNVTEALERLEEIKTETASDEKNKISKLITYITNNSDNIVNYQKRKDQGLVFTSQLAESNVESLINQRCKGQKHMKWSRDGLHPLLQIRAAVASNDWSKNWESYICGGTLKQAA